MTHESNLFVLYALIFFQVPGTHDSVVVEVNITFTIFDPEHPSTKSILNYGAYYGARNMKLLAVLGAIFL